MGRILERVQALAIVLGAPGLFVVAFLDSSVLSLPEIADVLVMWMVVQHKERLVLYAASATAGSVFGCLFLYYIGRKGGDALVRRRFRSNAVDRTLGSIQRFGVIAVLIPSILPPPAPFKIFVLLAGVARVGVGQFSLAIAIGRGARYFTEGVVALRYGDQAMAFVHDNAVAVSLGAVALLVAGLAGDVLSDRLPRRRAP